MFPAASPQGGIQGPCEGKQAAGPKGGVQPPLGPGLPPNETPAAGPSLPQVCYKNRSPGTAGSKSFL